MTIRAGSGRHAPQIATGWHPVIHVFGGEDHFPRSLRLLNVHHHYFAFHALLPHVIVVVLAQASVCRRVHRSVTFQCVVAGPNDPRANWRGILDDTYKHDREPMNGQTITKKTLGTSDHRHSTLADVSDCFQHFVLHLPRLSRR